VITLFQKTGRRGRGALWCYKKKLRGIFEGKQMVIKEDEKEE